MTETMELKPEYILKALKNMPEPECDGPSGEWLTTYQGLVVHALNLLAQPPAPADVVEKMAEALRNIAKRPDLPNPERDADWKACQKFSSHEAREALAAYEASLQPTEKG